LNIEQGTRNRRTSKEIFNEQFSIFNVQVLNK
jgi:hypothetical protein